MNLWWGTLEDPTFTQVIKIYLIISGPQMMSWIPDMMPSEGHSITSRVFLPSNA